MKFKGKAGMVRSGSITLYRKVRSALPRRGGESYRDAESIRSSNTVYVRQNMFLGNLFVWVCRSIGLVQVWVGGSLSSAVGHTTTARSRSSVVYSGGKCLSSVACSIDERHHHQRRKSLITSS